MARSRASRSCDTFNWSFNSSSVASRTCCALLFSTGVATVAATPLLTPSPFKEPKTRSSSDVSITLLPAASVDTLILPVFMYLCSVPRSFPTARAAAEMLNCAIACNTLFYGCRFMPHIPQQHHMSMKHTRHGAKCGTGNSDSAVCHI